MEKRALQRPEPGRVRALIKYIGNIDRRLEAITLEEPKQDLAVRNAVKAYKEDLTERVLRAMPIENLRQYRQGLRYQVLHQIGVSTVWDATRLTYTRLINMNGIGEQTARATLAAIADAQRDVQNSLAVRLSVDDKTKKSTALVRALYTSICCASIIDRATALYKSSHLNILPALRKARGAENKLHWLLSFPREKNAGLEAVNVLTALAEGRYSTESREIFDAYDAVLHASDEEIWDDFLRNPIDYNIRLEGGRPVRDGSSAPGASNPTPAGASSPRSPSKPSSAPRASGTAPRNPIYNTNAETVNDGKYRVNSHAGSHGYTDSNNRTEYTDRDRKHVRKNLSGKLGDQIERVPIDAAGLYCLLRTYQKFGVQYILSQKQVLLGDEMGLGKTIQAIAAMVCLRNGGETHFMVVCPLGVLINWCREIEKHSNLKYIKIHGKTAAEDFVLWQRRGGVAVTTYETLNKFELRHRYTIGLLVVDEAHYVKNPDAIRTQNVMEIKKHAQRCLFMTGTPLENEVKEMTGLIRVLQPKVAAEIAMLDQLSDAEEYREKVASVYFRRTREDVLTELPDREDAEEWNALTPEERLIYYEDTLGKRFMSMRQVSWNVADLRTSSKAKRLQEICADAEAEGRRILIFSFFLDTVNKVAALLGPKCCGVITGSVPGAQRQALIDRFSASPPGSALVAQIQSAGTGLNIQAASVVVICEPQIKPSIEDQAISRAYRMGQARKVLVYRLLSEESIDERIMEKLGRKREIFDEFADRSVAGEQTLGFTDAECDAMISAEIARLGRKPA